MNYENDVLEKQSPFETEKKQSWKDYTPEGTLSEYYSKQCYFMLRDIKYMLSVPSTYQKNDNDK